MSTNNMQFRNELNLKSERFIYDCGWNDSEERIIKLLDDWKCGHPDCDGDKTEVCYPKHYLIERIKGKKS